MAGLGEEFGIVKLGLGKGGGAQNLLEEALGALDVSGLPVGKGEQSGGALKVVAGVGGDHMLQIGAGGGKIAEFDFREASPVERIERIGALGKRLVEAGAGSGPIAFVEAQQSKLFVISRRRILPDRSFDFARPAAAFEKAEGAGVEQFREPLDGEIDQRAQRPKEDE